MKKILPLPAPMAGEKGLEREELANLKTTGCHLAFRCQAGGPGREDGQAQGSGEWVAGEASVLNEDQAAKQSFSPLHPRPHT